jgi:ribosomal protein S6E (S10)
MQVATRLAAQEPFYEARMEFADLIEQLLSPAAAGLTHSEAEECIEQRGREVLRQLLQGWLDARGPGDVGPVLGGRDGIRRTQRRRHSRQIESLFGEVEVERVGYGVPGQESVHPLDAALNLPAERYSHALRKKVAAEAARSSFEEVVEAITEHTGAQGPKRQAEELCQRAAQDFDACYGQRCTAPPEPQADSAGAIVVLTTDGKGIPMRKDALRPQTRKAAAAGTHTLRTRLSTGEKRHRTRMATVASVYDIAPYVRRADTVVRDLAPVREVRTERRPPPRGKRVWASVYKEPRAVIAEMFAEARGRDPEGQRPWVVLVDGHEHQLRLIRQEVKRRNVAVTLILDLFHVLEYLWAAAFAFHAAGSAESEVWVRTQLRALLQGRVSQVAAAMRRRATVRGLTASKRAAVDTCADYLLKYRAMLRYDQYLTAGYPIGTGVIEGACRYLVKDRMERTGARWSLPGAEAVLRLRALWTNGDFEPYWVFHLRREYERHHAACLGTDVQAGHTQNPGRVLHLEIIK